MTRPPSAIYYHFSLLRNTPLTRLLTRIFARPVNMPKEKATRKTKAKASEGKKKKGKSRTVHRCKTNAD